jgi:hypothetical protein
MYIQYIIQYMIRLIFEYAAEHGTWDPYLQKNMEELEKVQRIAARRVCAGCYRKLQVQQGNTPVCPVWYRAWDGRWWKREEK